MSRANGHDPNLLINARRGLPFGASHDRSRERKAELAATRPRTFGALLGWFKREWDADFARKLHERGIEPDSQLGAPRLAGKVRARFSALDDAKAATSTDYDREHDTWATGSSPRFPMLDALTRLRDGSPHRRGYPLSARILVRIAYLGTSDWRKVCCPHGEPDEVGELFLTATLNVLWGIWAEGQRDAGREVA
jgi:hypothetical protein